MGKYLLIVVSDIVAKMGEDFLDFEIDLEHTRGDILASPLRVIDGCVQSALPERGQGRRLPIGPVVDW